MNTKTPEISIIVPVYKVEPYLHKCVDSILAQTFEDFELILVDDGSPDNCPQICDEYANSDSRINVIHKENGGLSSARNAGIDIARGKYLGFIDSDDYIHNRMFEALRTNLVQNHADISICGLIDCYANSEKKYMGPAVYETYTAGDALRIILQGTVVSVNPTNKLYKRQIFNDLRYPVGKTTEDAFIIVEVLSRAHRVHIDSTPYYYYVRRADSITTRAFSESDFDVIAAYEQNVELIDQRFPHLHLYALRRLLWANSYVLGRLAGEPKHIKKLYAKEVRMIQNFFCKNAFNIFRIPHSSAKARFSYLTIIISPSLYMKIRAKIFDRKVQLKD